MNKKSIAILMLVSLCSMNIAFSSTNYAYQPIQVQQAYNNQYIQQPVQTIQNNTLQGNVVMIPAGTELRPVLTTPLSSEYCTAGQTVTMALREDFYHAGQIVAPAGSTIYGTVIDVSKAKRGSINGRLCVRFNQIYTPYGTQIPISAVIKTDDLSGVLVGGTKLDVTKEYTKDLAVGSAAGALSGLVFGALAGGDVGRGAALGTAVGAGGGLVKSVWDKGNDVVIPANAAINIVLTQPVTVSASPYLN